MAEHNRIDLNELTVALDRPLKTLRWQHLMLFPLLACCWLFSTNGFIDIFIMQPVDLSDCMCEAEADIPPGVDLCQACDGTVRCPLHPSGSWTTASRAWGLYCAADWQRSLPSESTQAGVAIGELVVGPVADRAGRRRAVVGFAALAATAYAASSAAPGIGVYVLAKAVLGAATAATSISGFTLASELAGPSLRTRLTVELWSYAWTTMSCVLPLVALALSHASWRALVLAVALPYALFACTLAATVPESPLWLQQHGGSQRLARVLHILLGDGAGQRLLTSSSGVSPPLAATQCEAAAVPTRTSPEAASGQPSMTDDAHADLARANTEPAAAIRPCFDSEEEAPSADRTRRELGRGCLSVGLGGFRALFRDARRARTTLAESYLWAACALSYYGISFNSAELSGNVYTNFVLVSLPLYPVAFVGSRLMDEPRLGRRGAAALFFTCLALALGVAALLPQYAIGASMVANFFALAAFNLVYVQAAELYPTSVRSTASGFFSAVSRLATFVAIALPALAGPRITLAVIAVVDACALPFVALVPETRGVLLAAE